MEIFKYTILTDMKVNANINADIYSDRNEVDKQSTEVRVFWVM